MNDEVETTRLAPRSSDSLAKTMVAKTVVAKTVVAKTAAATVHPTRPYGTAQPVAVGDQDGSRARIAPVAGWLAAALGLAALALFVPWTPESIPPVAPEQVAVLEIAHGTVGLIPPGAGQERLLALAAGQPVTAGAVIETGAGAAGVALAAAGRRESETGRAAVRLAGGQSVRLDTDTRVRLVSASTLVLESGAVYVDTAAVDTAAIDTAAVDTAAGRAGTEVRTTLGVVHDIGTQFEVRLSESALRVRVREGTVALKQGDGEAHEAGTGVEMVVTDEGTLTRGTVPIYGLHWDWVLEAAPAPAIEGRPLRLFLDWLARENGWTLRFADPATVELAAATILHGDLEGLTPAQAARVVFRSSGLDYRVEDGVLTVGADR